MKTQKQEGRDVRILWILVIVVAVLAEIIGWILYPPELGVFRSTRAGFWLGVWDGLGAGIVWVISWFKDVSLYNANNNGIPYRTGFMLGIWLLMQFAPRIRIYTRKR